MDLQKIKRKIRSDSESSIERRFLSTDQIELRAAKPDSNSPGTLVGYAIVFNTPSVPLSLDSNTTFVEYVAPGAFAESLADESIDPQAYFGHDPNRILGRESAKTLILTVDEKGLKVEIDLPDTTDGRDAAVSIGRRDIVGMSFGFEVRDETGEDWSEQDGHLIRILKNINLYEVSITANPAYSSTSVAVRSLSRFLSQTRHVVQKEDGTWWVKKENGKGYFNDHPLTHKEALKLMAAIEISKHKMSRNDDGAEESSQITPDSENAQDPVPSERSARLSIELAKARLIDLES